MRRFWRFLCSGAFTERDRRNQRKVTGWSFAWMMSWVGASILIRNQVAPGVATYAAVLVPTLLGVMTVIAYVEFLREAEELQRKIQLDALALGFGVGLVAAVSWELLKELGVVEGDPSDVLFFMVLAYGLGIWLGVRRYR